VSRHEAFWGYLPSGGSAECDVLKYKVLAYLLQQSVAVPDDSLFICREDLTQVGPHPPCGGQDVGVREGATKPLLEGEGGVFGDIPHEGIYKVAVASRGPPAPQDLDGALRSFFDCGAYFEHDFLR
jgi:hypothetical protein